MNKRQWKKTRCAVTHKGITLSTKHYVKPKNRPAIREWFKHCIDKMHENWVQLLSTSQSPPKRNWFSLNDRYS